MRQSTSDNHPAQSPRATPAVSLNRASQICSTAGRELCEVTPPSTLILAAAAALVLGLGVTGAGALEKGQPSGVFYEPLEVPLVSVEVYVSDRDGQPVRGLTPAEFTVLEDGEPVEISHFYAAEGVAGNRPPESTESETDRLMLNAPSQALYLVVYVDETNFTRSFRSVALNNLRSFFKSDLPEDLRVMLITYNGKLNVKQPLTERPELLLDAIAGLKREASLAYGMAKNAILMEIQKNANPSLREHRPEGSRAINVDPMIEVGIAEQVFQEIESYAKERRHRTLKNLDALRRLVRSLSGLPGRKAIFYLSDGIDLQPGEDLFRIWARAYANLARERGINPTFRAKRFSVKKEMKKIVEYANAYRVSFYTLSGLNESILAPTSAATRGIEGTSGLEIMPWSNEEAFIQMTDGTGGRTLANNSNLDVHLHEVAVELGAYYSLGYLPRDSTEDRYHRIKVKVDRKGVTVRHREGYRTNSIADRMADRTLSAAVHGICENPLGVTVETREQRRSADGSYTVPVLIKVPLDQIVLLPQQTTHQGTISVFLVVRDHDGGMSAVQHRQYPVEIPNEQLLSAMSQEAGFVVGLRMRQGEQVLAVGVRDELSNLESTVVLDVIVGEGNA